MVGQTGASLGKWARYIDSNDTDPAFRVNQRGTGLILDLRDGGVSVFSVDQLGVVTFGSTGALTVADDKLFRWGTDGDTGSKNISAGVNANTASAGVLEGTPVTPIAIAANSLVIGNLTDNGDIVIAVSKAGTSHMAFMADGSTGDTLLGVPTGQSIDGYVAGTKVLDIAANLATYEAAAGTSNQRLLVSNTSNTGAASEHAIIEASVGGTTTIGHPQFRWTIPGGTSWYAGPQNNDSDIFKIGTGASLGSAAYFAIDGRTSGVAANLQFTFNTNNVTASDGATAGTDVVRIAAHTVTLAGATTVTSFHAMLDVRAMTINQSGGAVTVNEAAGVGAFTVTAGASVTLTHSSAFRARTGGAAVNLSGFYAEAQTAGTTGNYQILMVNGGTQPVALANHVGMGVIDFAGGDARLYINAELGSSIILGNNSVRTGLAGTGTGSFVMSGATSGVVTLTVAATAGTWTMTLPAAVGGIGEQLTDAGGNGITSWAAAGSRREYKNILGVLEPRDALDAILHTVPYRFRYKDGMGTLDTDTLYAGPMADEAPWAMHYQGGIVNPVNTLGYMIGGFQAVQGEIDELRSQIAGLQERVKVLEVI